MRFVLIVFCVFNIGFGMAISTNISSSLMVNQTKDKYIVLEINKYESEFQMNELLQFLNSQDEKISSASFNYENRHLTVYYSSNLDFKDICRMVLLYYQDVNKISGTGL